MAESNLKSIHTLDVGSDTWNIAQGYTSLKLLKPLVEMDKYVKIALYGCEIGRAHV